MAEERQGWYPGKFAKGLLGKVQSGIEGFKARGRERTAEGSAEDYAERQNFAPVGVVSQDRANMTQHMGKEARGDAFASLMDKMQNLDTSDSQSVMDMQRMLNMAGVTDSEGNPLAEDGMMGAKTLSALRGAQSFRDEMVRPEFEGTKYDAGGTRGIPQPQVDASGPGGRLNSYTPPRGQGGRMY